MYRHRAWYVHTDKFMIMRICTNIWTNPIVYVLLLSYPPLLSFRHIKFSLSLFCYHNHAFLDYLFRSFWTLSAFLFIILILSYSLSSSFTLSQSSLFDFSVILIFSFFFYFLFYLHFRVILLQSWQQKWLWNVKQKENKRKSWKWELQRNQIMKIEIE